MDSGGVSAKLPMYRMEAPLGGAEVVVTGIVEVVDVTLFVGGVGPVEHPKATPAASAGNQRVHPINVCYPGPLIGVDAMTRRR